MEKTNIDFTKYKFIVSTGCSYGVVHQSFAPNYYLAGGNGYEFVAKDDILGGKHDWVYNTPTQNKFEFKDNIISISVGLSSSGARWQSDSVLYTIKKLLDIGVPSENIYCYVEWSEFMRVTQIVPFEYGDEFHKLNRWKWKDEHKIQFIPNYKEKTYDQRFENDTKQLLDEDVNALNYLENQIQISRFAADVTMGMIEDSIYITTSQIPINSPKYNLKIHNEEISWEDTLGLEVRLFTLINQLHEVDKRVTQSNIINDYLDTIIKTQCFLKLNNIKHNFTFINSQLADFYKEGGELKYYNEREYDRRLNHLIELKPLEEVYTNFKSKMKLLDWSNFSMYETDIYKRGGIDELLYDMFGETIYSSAWGGDNSFPETDIRRHRATTPIKGYHPSALLYPFVWDFVAKDCDFIRIKKEWLTELRRKFTEDYNSDKPTIHGLSISKKYYEQLLKKF